MSIFKELNIKWDVRTLKNFCVLPLILCIRIPLVLLYRFFQYITKQLDYISDRIPGWETYTRKSNIAARWPYIE